MFPPAQGLKLNIDAISGICGSISIACWIVVFSPQIIENFRRRSADGLSLLFLVVWLAGDVFNILGAILQGVLPTMIILAVYYTLADIVLLGQCLYYRGFILSNASSFPSKPAEAVPSCDGASREPTETSGLLDATRSPSPTTFSHLDGAQHLSPATPLLDPAGPAEDPFTTVSPPGTTRSSTLQSIVFNTISISLVCLAGVLGWWLSNYNNDSDSYSSHAHSPSSSSSSRTSALEFNVAGQVFGYLCAVLYLGSRVPQILLNFRRKSTEGVSMLFFLFACIGNLTYVMSILAFAPTCSHPHHQQQQQQNWHEHHQHHSAHTSHGGGDQAGYHLARRTCDPGAARDIYARYVLVNASWLLGSLGTLVLDLGIFVQFFVYRGDEAEGADEGVEGGGGVIDEE
ncbi:MAG: hypothetical protein M1838_004605 [Thelocarpon superellum]|nr:MAG: hypothetical protein M1838_004605 [Thelocarpon superellum]